MGKRKPKVADRFGAGNRYFLFWKAEVVAREVLFLYAFFILIYDEALRNEYDTRVMIIYVMITRRIAA